MVVFSPDILSFFRMLFYFSDFRNAFNSEMRFRGKISKPKKLQTKLNGSKFNKKGRKMFKKWVKTILKKGSKKSQRPLKHTKQAKIPSITEADSKVPQSAQHFQKPQIRAKKDSKPPKTTKKGP